jgi:hypothetical protein
MTVSISRPAIKTLSMGRKGSVGMVLTVDSFPFKGKAGMGMVLLDASNQHHPHLL